MTDFQPSSQQILNSSVDRVVANSQRWPGFKSQCMPRIFSFNFFIWECLRQSTNIMEFWTHFLHNIRSKIFGFIQNKNMEHRFVKIWNFDLFTLWQTGNCLKNIWDHDSIKQRNIFSIQISLQIPVL